MKALLAIFVTISLLIGVYLISALVYFDLAWFLVVISSLWAAFDSKRIELRRYKLGSGCTPAALFCLCYIFWFIFFPYYLWLRFKIKEGTAELQGENFSDLEPHPIKTFFRRFSKIAGRLARWLLIGITAFKIGFLFFCIEECWRGQRVWENYKHELEAEGESLDWDAMIPPSVPDSQNFFSAPMMSAWFVQPSRGITMTDDIAKRLICTRSSPETEIAEITFVQSGTHLDSEKADILLRFDDPQSGDQVKKLIQNAIGPYAFGAQGLTLTVQSLDTNKIKRPRIFLVTDEKRNAKDLIAFFFGSFSSAGPLIFRPDGSNSWRVLTPLCTANDYLKWSDQFERDFDLMREAVKRPYARLEGDYSFPPTIPIPNYASVRAVSQTLAQRAQCYLLLNQPGNALQELSLLNTLRSKFEGAPTGKPMTLVSAMINVALAGLYVNTLNDGFRLQSWKEPQLAMLEAQLNGIDLAPFLKESFHEEEASSVRLSEILIRGEETRRDDNANLWRKINNVKSPNITRGFFYFNVVTVVSLEQIMVDSIDPSNETVSVSKAAEFSREEDMFNHTHFWQIPYRLYAMIAVPNFAKAVQTFAFYQTKIDEAQIVCALERFRLGHGSYPLSLNDLSPKYISKLPHDIINGQPLKYVKTRDDGFRLYSIGWNQIDDGGQFSSSYDQGDWVWQP